jgi:hypothetical protein
MSAYSQGLAVLTRTRVPAHTLSKTGDIFGPSGSVGAFMIAVGASSALFGLIAKNKAPWLLGGAGLVGAGFLVAAL